MILFEEFDELDESESELESEELELDWE